MRALVLKDWRKLAVAEIDPPTTTGAGVLVRVIATGICGSDVHGFTGENGRREFGQVMGHETVGRIEALGSDVPSGPGLEIGNLVTVNPVIGCGHCARCLSGNSQVCADKTVIGVSSAYISAFAELFVAPVSNVVPLTPGTPAEYGALVEPLAVGYHAARRGGIRTGDSVLVVGGGPIGQACVLAAQRLGAEQVVLSEPSHHRRELCGKLGANTIDPTAVTDLSEAVAIALGRPPTVIIDAVGTTTSLASALACAPLMSTVVLVGMGHQTLDVPAYELSTKERSIVGSFCYTPQEFAETALWVGATDKDLSLLIEGHVDLDGANEAFTELARGDGSTSKVLVMLGD